MTVSVGGISAELRADPALWEAAMKRSAASLDVLAARAEAAGKQMRVTSRDAEQASTAMKGLRGAADAVDQKLSRFQIALGGVNQALGVQDSHLRNVVGGAADLAMAFAVGGPLMLGVTAIGVGVGALADRWKDVEDSADDAKAAQFAALMEGGRAVDDAIRGLLAKRGGGSGDRNLAEEEVAFRGMQLADTDARLGEMTDSRLEYLRDIVDHQKRGHEEARKELLEHGELLEQRAAERKALEDAKSDLQDVIDLENKHANAAGRTARARRESVDSIVDLGNYLRLQHGELPLPEGRSLGAVFATNQTPDATQEELDALAELVGYSDKQRAFQAAPEIVVGGAGGAGHMEEVAARASDADAALEGVAGALGLTSLMGGPASLALAAVEGVLAKVARLGAAAGGVAGLVGNEGLSDVAGVFGGALGAAGSVAGAGLNPMGFLDAADHAAGALESLARVLAHTESFEKFQGVMDLAADAAIAGFEPIFDALLPLSIIVFDLAEAFGGALSSLLDLDGVGEVLFEGFRALALGALHAAKLLQLITMTDDEAVSAAISDLEGLTYGGARDRANELLAENTSATKDLTSAFNRSEQNVPSWYKVQGTEFNAIDGRAGMNTRGGRTTVINIREIVARGGLQQLLEEIEDMNTSTRGDRASTGGRGESDDETN